MNGTTKVELGVELALEWTTEEELAVELALVNKKND